MTPTTNLSPAAQNATPGTLAERMEATAQAVAAAHGARLHEAIDGVRWERRGLLGRLTRTGR
ncbi:MAG TPA: hypothetical protein VH300_09530 [Thermoleophilaceae bacterium]|nr:hypothetical protein [Thermoleophilaceae bacterium]